jgi:hypothetical protein
LPANYYYRLFILAIPTDVADRFVSFLRYPVRIPPTRPKVFGLGGFVKIAIVIAMLSGAGWLFFQNTVHSKLTGAVADKIQTFVQPLGMTSQIGGAHFNQGVGLSLDNVSLELPSTSQQPSSKLSIAQIQIHSKSTLTDLVSGSLQPQAIELKRAKFQIVRDPSGTIDLTPVVQQLANFPRPAGQKLAPIVLRDSEIQFFDLGQNLPSVQLTNVNFVVSPKQHQSSRLIHIQGEFRTPAISKITVSLFVNLDNQDWQAQLTADQATISQQIIDSLPPSIAGQIAQPDSLSGTLSFSATADSRHGDNALPRFELNGRLERFSLDDSRLPLPLRDCSATFLINNDGVVVQNAAGTLEGQSTFNVSYVQSGLLQKTAWRCKGDVKQFLFDRRPRLRPWLPKFCDKFCRDFSPTGTSDISFDLSHDGNKLSRTITGILTDMSFSFIRMPYRVDHCTGQVKLVNDRCDFVLRSKIENQPVGLHGFANNLGPGLLPTYQVNLQVPGSVRIDEKLLTAADAQPKLAEVVRAFNPTGRVGGSGTIERRKPLGPIEKRFELRLSDCNIRHKNFDYPIYNVAGNVSVKNSSYVFKNLSGNNSSGFVDCQGVWNAREGLNLNFQCRSIPLNDQLRLALKPEIQAIWQGFQPRGTIDQLNVAMTMPVGAKEVELDVEATLPEVSDANSNYVSIFPTWFPYKINYLAGKINVGHGRIVLTDMSGRHNSTTLACHGRGSYSDASWSLRLKNLLVNSLQVDADLLAAVPKSMQTPLAQLRFSGLANVNGQITLGGAKQSNQFNQRQPRSNNPRPSTGNTIQLVSHLSTDAGDDSRYDAQVQDSKSSMAWNVTVNMAQASMLVGLPLKNVFGGVKLTGIYDGETVVCNGQVDFDSLTAYDNQVTNVTGPFKIENHRVSAGTFVNAETRMPSQMHASNIRTGQPPSRQINTANSISGILHKGVVRLDAQMNTSTKGEFYLQTTMADGCLLTACQELAPDLQDVSGHSFAQFRMQGDASGTHSHRGNGTIQLRDAKIYELPVFISLLKILNVRQLTRTAFDSGDIEFQIMGERIIFDRMEFTGDAISLIGNGEMNLDWDIDLDFYSVMGRNKIEIPLISKLYRAGSQRTLAIKIDGKLDNPRTHRQVLPELNDNLNRLFNGQQKSLARQIKPLPARPSTTNQPIHLGESYFQQPSNQPIQFPNRLRR